MNNAEKTKAHCDALAGGTSTLAQQNKLAEALFNRDPATYAALTNAEKARIIPAAFLVMARDQIDRYNRRLRELQEGDGETIFPDTAP